MSRFYEQWRNTWGAECPPETFHWEIFGDYLGKMRKGKKLKNGKCLGKCGKMKKRRMEIRKNFLKIKKEGGK